MSKVKAVVLEKTGSMYTVLAEDGSFRRIRYTGQAEIGQEIDINAGTDMSRVRIIAAIAAVFLLIFLATMGWNLYQTPVAVAMLSIDINPSLEFALDAQGNVVSLVSKNTDAEKILSRIKLKGLPWDEALTRIIKESMALNFLNQEHPWVLIGYSPVQSEELPSRIPVQDIAAKIVQTAEGNGIIPRLAVYQLSLQEKDLAKQKELTLGEYALMMTAQKAGLEVQAETVKNSGERAKLLEQPQVQAQMRVDKNLYQKLPSPSSPSGSPGNIREDKDNNEKNKNNGLRNGPEAKGNHLENSPMSPGGPPPKSSEDKARGDKENKGMDKEKGKEDHSKDKESGFKDSGKEDDEQKKNLPGQQVIAPNPNLKLSVPALTPGTANPKPENAKFEEERGEQEENKKTGENK